jgi:hypothetical protein
MGPSGRNIPHEGARVPLRSDPTDDHNSGSAHTNMQHTAGHGHEEQHQVRATQPGQTPEDLQDFATWWTVAIRHTTKHTKYLRSTMLVREWQGGKKLSSRT